MEQVISQPIQEFSESLGVFAASQVIEEIASTNVGPSGTYYVEETKIQCRLTETSISWKRKQQYESIFSLGTLLHHVQLAKIYNDGKTYVDLLASRDINEIMDEWHALLQKAHMLHDFRLELENFVKINFSPVGWELEPIEEPIDWMYAPRYIETVQCPRLHRLAFEIHRLWKILAKQVRSSVLALGDKTSMLYVPYPIVIPGGRFRENYYWDSYWTLKGLLKSGLTSLAKGIVLNNLFLIEQYGFVPNGTRTYYLNRSQPPMLISMMEEYVKFTGDDQFLKFHVDTLVKEMDWWNKNRLVEVEWDGVTHRMFRYDCLAPGPRPESYREDFELAETIHFSNEDKKSFLFRNLKAAAESGWDFSSRWFIDGNGERSSKLEDCKPVLIIPVDLNAIMFKNFRSLASMLAKCGRAEMAAEYSYRSAELMHSVMSLLYHEKTKTWRDFDMVNRKQRDYYYASNLIPLWAGCFPEHMRNELGEAAAHYITGSNALLPGGLVTSTFESGQQWDFPNCWAPLQEFVVTGLLECGGDHATQIAKRIAKNFVNNALISFENSPFPVLYEKYDALDLGKVGHGGEYETQAGFGWTNGTISCFMAEFGDDLTK